MDCKKRLVVMPVVSTWTEIFLHLTGWRMTAAIDTILAQKRWANLRTSIYSLYSLNILQDWLSPSTPGNRCWTAMGTARMFCSCYTNIIITPLFGKKLTITPPPDLWEAMLAKHWIPPSLLLNARHWKSVLISKVSGQKIKPGLPGYCNQVW